MAKTRPGRRSIHDFALEGTNMVVRAGDCVEMLPEDPNEAPYVALIEKMEANHLDQVTVHVQWYYRPEEICGGRKQFHGAKELLLSDQYDTQSAASITGICRVHSFVEYVSLPSIGDNDYFCRYQYKAATSEVIPQYKFPYCECNAPRNPDKFMIQCIHCEDWFHPSAVDMIVEVAQQSKIILCPYCTRLPAECPNCTRHPAEGRI